jgi:uncharacterized membrane protein YfcA
VAVLALAVRARRRLADPLAGLLVAGVTVGHLLLFNPRTQSNSYVMAAPIAALLAVTWWFEQRWKMAWALAAIVLAWSGNSHSLRVTEYWLKPLAGICFVVILAREILRAPAPESAVNSSLSATTPSLSPDLSRRPLPLR